MVDCTGLENRQRATVREFESHRFRQTINEYASFEAFLISTHTSTHMKLVSFVNQVDDFLTQL